MIGMEEYGDCKFENKEDYRGAILSVLDNELEVFDPLCDGEVEISEGIAYLREEIDKFFKKEFDFDNIEGELNEYLSKRKNRIGMSFMQKEGYDNGILVMKDVLDVIRKKKEDYDISL